MADAAAAGAETIFLQRVLVQDEEKDGGYGYRAVDVLLKDGVIADINAAGCGQCPDGVTAIDGGEHGFLLLPGSVNGHAHSSEHWARGLIKPLPLELWLHELVRLLCTGTEC